MKLKLSPILEGAVFVFLVSLLLLWYAHHRGYVTSIGTSMPAIALITAFMLSFISIVSEIRKQDVGVLEEYASGPIARMSWIEIVLLAMLSLSYYYLFFYVGIIVSTFFIISAISIVLSNKLVIKNIIAACIVSICIWLIFSVGSRTFFPRGILI